MADPDEALPPSDPKATEGSTWCINAYLEGVDHGGLCVWENGAWTLLPPNL